MNKVWLVEYVEDICGDYLSVKNASFSTKEKAIEHYNYVLKHIKEIEKEHREENNEDLWFEEDDFGYNARLVTFGGEDLYRVSIIEDTIDNSIENLEWF